MSFLFAHYSISLASISLPAILSIFEFEKSEFSPKSTLEPEFFFLFLLRFPSVISLPAILEMLVLENLFLCPKSTFESSLLVVLLSVCSLLDSISIGPIDSLVIRALLNHFIMGCLFITMHIITNTMKIIRIPAPSGVVRYCTLFSFSEYNCLTNFFILYYKT